MTAKKKFDKIELSIEYRHGENTERSQEFNEINLVHYRHHILTHSAEDSA